MQVVQGLVQDILQSGKAIGNGHILKLGANRKGLDGLCQECSAHVTCHFRQIII